MESPAKTIPEVKNPCKNWDTASAEEKAQIKEFMAFVQAYQEFIKHRRKPQAIIKGTFYL